MPFRPLFAIAACALIAMPVTSHAASCEWSQRFATDIVTLGTKARETYNELEARRLVTEARPVAIDAAKEAKQCGCDAAIPNFEDAALHAAYAGRAANITAMHQYGARVRTAAEKALEALRRCGS